MVALMARMGVTDLRLTGGEPLVRREFPRLVSMLSRVEGLEDLSLTTNGYLLERDAAALVDAGITRVNVSIDSLQRDRFFELTRRDSLPQVLRGLEAIGGLPAGEADQGQRRRAARLHRGGGAAVRRVRPLDELPGALHRVHAAGRRPRLDQRPGAAGRRDPRRSSTRVHPLEELAARAALDGARVPLPRRPRRDRLHQPGVRAVLRGLQPHPADRRGQAPHLPVLDPRDRPARAAPRRRERRRARADRARRGLAQGAEAPRGRAGLPPAAAHDAAIGG